MKISRIIWVLVAAGAAALALLVYSQTKPKPPHSVTLHWSPSANATAYNIYRATTSGGPYSKIGTAPSPSYVDTNVSSGAVFFYVVTAENHGKESAYSKEIKAAVP
jgi:fibronectin type 3 domain-containing protein